MAHMKEERMSVSNEQREKTYTIGKRKKGPRRQGREMGLKKKNCPNLPDKDSEINRKTKRNLHSR